MSKLNYLRKLASLLFFFPAYMLHDMGHYIGARLMGVRVIDFSLSYSDVTGIDGAALYLDNVKDIPGWKRVFIGCFPVLLGVLAVAFLLEHMIINNWSVFPYGWLDAYIFPEIFIMGLICIPTYSDME